MPTPVSLPPSGEPPPEIAIPIRFEGSAGEPRNLGLTGEGRLVIRPEGPIYVFEGSVRSAFSTRRRALQYRASDIWNVGVAGARVQFQSSRAGGSSAWFIFYCASPEQALAVARMMPSNREPDLAAAADFRRKLWGAQSTTGPARVSVTNVIIGLNILVFVVLAGFFGAGWLEPGSMRPYILYGANNGGATTDGEWWRLLTSMFMHFGVFHIAFNMWAYFQAGHLAERLFGKVNYLLGYLAAGVAGGFASIFWNGDKVWSAGASGAIFGVYGLILGYLVREKRRFPQGVFRPMIRSTIGFAIYNLIFGSVYQGIDNSAHVGGFVMGIVLGLAMALPIDGPERTRQLTPRFLVGALLTVAMVIAGITFTPRFNYHFREELAWSDAITPYLSQEKDIETRFSQVVADYRQGSLTETELGWVSSTCIPFYSQWLDAARALKLTPGLETAKRREKVDRMVAQQLAGCRRFLRLASDRREPGEI